MRKTLKYRKRPYRRVKKTMKTMYKRRPNRSILGNIRGDMIISPKAFTKLKLGYQGYVAAGSGGNKQFTIYANQLYQPFNTSVPVSSYFTSTNSSSTTSQYNGYTFLNTAYSTYKIHSSKLTVKVNIVSNQDGANLVILPAPYSQTVSGSFSQEIGQDKAKSKLIVAQSTGKDSYVYNSCLPRNVIGYTKNEWLAIPPYVNNTTTLSGTPFTNQLAVWTVMLQTLDGLVFAAAVYIDIVIEAYVEFGNPNQLNG